MGTVAIQRNPMDLSDRESFQHNGPLIDFIVERFPRGFPGPTSVLRNGRRVQIPDLDVVIDAGDDVHILIIPEGIFEAIGLTWAIVGQALAAAAVSTALTYVASWLRGAPDTPGTAAVRTPSPTYSLSVPTNQARLGETMPVVYGTVLTVPDIISQPYTYFENNDQYVAMILGVGRGLHRINYLLVSDTTIETLSPGTFGWWNYPPASHLQQFGKIQTETGIYEDVDTSAEVANQELEGTTSTGPFITNRVGSTTQLLGFDFVFPAGIYQNNPADGILIGDQVDIHLEIWGIDINDNETGYFQAGVASYVSDSSDPVRGTYWVNVPKGRYKASVRRNTAPRGTVGSESRVTWTGLKAVLDDPVASVKTLYRLDTNLETNLSGWTTIGVDTWGLVAQRDCDGTLSPRSSNPTFIASDVLSTDTTDKSIYRTFDVSEYAASIDLGGVRCIAEVWASGQSTENDVPGLLVQFLNDVGGELAAHSEFGTTTCTWGLTAVEISELMPAGTRTIVFLLDATYVAGTATRCYFDDAVLTLSGLGEGDTVQVYEDMHLIPVLMKATNGISQDAARRIAINVTKTYNAFPTYNPADAMEDIFLNTSYGGARPVEELDTAGVDALRQKLVFTAGFNAIFDSQTTVWEAMQRALRPGDATPTVYGGQVTVIEDIFKPTTAFAFDTTRIVDGSVKVSRNFDYDETYDSYEVEYLDPISFLPQYVRYPVDGVKPENVSYFGCTNKELAEHQAEFLWKKKYWRRKTVTFETEAIGNLPLVGDLISVVHPAANDGVTPENYIVSTITPAGQFSVTIEAIRDSDVYSPIPYFGGQTRLLSTMAGVG